MASSGTSNVYAHVMEDVISKVRDELIDNGGAGEGVLTELQGLWELKMVQAGALLGPIDRSAIRKTLAGGPITPNPVHDLNVPYEGTEEYETPTTDLLFPPTPLQTPVVQTPLPGMVQTPLPGMAHTPFPGVSQNPLPVTYGSSLYDNATASLPIIPNEFSSASTNGVVPDGNTMLGRSNFYMQPPSSRLNQKSTYNVNAAYLDRQEGGSSATHQVTQDFLTMSSGKRKRGEFSQHYHTGGHIPQQDGAGDILSDVQKAIGGFES